MREEAEREGVVDRGFARVTEQFLQRLARQRLPEHEQREGALNAPRKRGVLRIATRLRGAAEANLHLVRVHGTGRQGKRTEVVIAAVLRQSQVVVDLIELHLTQDVAHHSRQLLSSWSGEGCKVGIVGIDRRRPRRRRRNRLAAQFLERVHQLRGLSLFQLNPGSSLKVPIHDLRTERFQSKQIVELGVLKSAADDFVDVAAESCEPVIRHLRP